LNENSVLHLPRRAPVHFWPPEGVDEARPADRRVALNGNAGAPAGRYKMDFCVQLAWVALFLPALVSVPMLIGTVLGGLDGELDEHEPVYVVGVMAANVLILVAFLCLTKVLFF